MREKVQLMQKEITFDGRDVSPSLKGLLMDKGHGHVEDAIREAELNIETIETIMVNLRDEFNAENAPFVKLYVRREKRIVSGARSRTFLMWTARNDLKKASDSKIVISALVDPLETHKTMGDDVMRILKSDRENYQKIVAYDFIRHKMNAVYSLQYEKYKTLRELGETVSRFRKDDVDASMKRVAREINKKYIEIPSLESLFSV
jgi:hypothetical protein